MSDNANSGSLQARIYGLLEKQPDHPTIAFYNRQGEYPWQTLEQFYNKAAGFAGTLRDFSLTQNEVCLIVLPSDELSATLIFASLILGAIPLLVAPPSMQAAGAFSSLQTIISRVARKTNPRIIIIPSSMVGFSEKIITPKSQPQPTIISETDLKGSSNPTFSPVTPAAEDLAAMQLTSGTTGFPRVCVWKQNSILAALDGMKIGMNLQDDDIFLNRTPLYHDMGLVNNFFMCLANGIPLAMLGPIDFVKTPALWLQGLNKTRATMTWSPNFGFAITSQRTRDQELQNVQLDHVRGFWNAAERIHQTTIEAFSKRFAPYGLRSNALKTNFGCAENIGGATFSDPEKGYVYEKIDRKLFQSTSIAKEIIPTEDNDAITVVGVGKPHPGIRIEILSAEGHPLKEGEVGEIALDTPSRMEGYLGDKEATDNAIIGNLLRTGDLGYLRDGELFWVGRVRERLNIRGVKIDPSDFEPILLNVDGLRHGNFAAFGVDDKVAGTQQIVIVTEVRLDLGISPEEITENIRNMIFSNLGLNVFDIILVKPGTLTKTSSGKRRHRYFSQLYSEGSYMNTNGSRTRYKLA